MELTHTTRCAWPLRILTNARWFDHPSGRAIVGMRLRTGGSAMLRRALRAARTADAVVLNIATRELFVFCLLKRLVGRRRWRLISVDLVLTAPRTWRERLCARTARWLLHAVDCFILYFTDTAALRAAYGIPAERVRYVPFKVNDIARLEAARPRDDGYILVAGRTERDYETLWRAVEGLPYRVVVLRYVGRDFEHGAGAPDVAHVPANVEIVPDRAAETWIDWLAGARVVALPIHPGAITASGISTYLQAMALGKCVVISRGPAVNGLLEDGQAVLVPPGDPDALRAALRHACEDHAFRARVAAAGRAYARALGGYDRLAQDIVDVVVAELRDGGAIVAPGAGARAASTPQCTMSESSEMRTLCPDASSRTLYARG